MSVLFYRLLTIYLPLSCPHSQEEQNSGTSRHLWVELPVVLNQPYYVPGDEDDEDDLSDEAVHERFQRLYGVRRR